MDSASATTLSTTQEYRMAVGTRILESAAAAAADDFTDSSRSFVSDHFGLFIFLVACSISLVIMFSMIIREYYWRKYGVDVCPGTGPRGRSRNVASQIMSDQAMAVELQRQLNEEIREQERLEKRKERRAWYESYIKPYTMEVQESDFFTATEEEAKMGTDAPPTHDSFSNISLKLASDEEVDEESEELDIVPEEDEESQVLDIEVGKRKMTSDSERTNDTVESSDSTYEYQEELGKVIEETGNEEDIESPTALNGNDSFDENHYEDDGTHLYLRLPVNNKDGSRRCVDAHCAICIGEYEAGDRVVWSGLDECKHAFHDECILPWLSKGKKRCPVCRHWFVPGTKIDDQKAALEAESNAVPSSPTMSTESDNQVLSENGDAIELEQPSVSGSQTASDAEDLEIGLSGEQPALTQNLDEPRSDPEICSVQPVAAAVSAT